MHPRIAELVGYLDAQRAVLRAAFDAVPAALRERAPAADRWSAANIIEHLAIVEERIAGLLRAEIDAGRASRLPAETCVDPILPALNLDRVALRRTRVSSPERSRPSGLDADAAWSALERATPKVYDALRAGDGLDLTRLSIPHPILGPLDGYAWFGFIGAHEARHAAQIVEAYQGRAAI